MLETMRPMQNFPGKPAKESPRQAGDDSDLIISNIE